MTKSSRHTPRARSPPSSGGCSRCRGLTQSFDRGCCRRYTVGDTYTALDADSANELLEGEIEKLQTEVRAAACTLIGLGGGMSCEFADCTDPTPDPPFQGCLFATASHSARAPQMEKQEKELSTIVETQSELKTHLYAKFGKSINLEE